MTETTILDERAVSEIEARAGDKWTVNTDTIRALCATVKHLRAESFRYKTGFDDYVRKLETDNERLTTGLVNLYHVITNQQCERKVALGMATSAVSSLQSQLEQLRAERDELRNALLPFALLDIRHLQDRSDHEPIWAINKSQITNGHVRVAQRLIQQAVAKKS